MNQPIHFNNPLRIFPSPDARIALTVYLLGGNDRIKAGSSNAFGLANRNLRTAWVMGESILGRQPADIAQTIAHEIGHIQKEEDDGRLPK